MAIKTVATCDEKGCEATEEFPAGGMIVLATKGWGYRLTGPPIGIPEGVEILCPEHKEV